MSDQSLVAAVTAAGSAGPFLSPTATSPEPPLLRNVRVPFEVVIAQPSSPARPRPAETDDGVALRGLTAALVGASSSGIF